MGFMAGQNYRDLFLCLKLSNNARHDWNKFELVSHLKITTKNCKEVPDNIHQQMLKAL